MTDFFGGLLARAAGETGVAPRPVTLFEPVTPGDFAGVRGEPAVSDEPWRGPEWARDGALPVPRKEPAPIDPGPVPAREPEAAPTRLPPPGPPVLADSPPVKAAPVEPVDFVEPPVPGLDPAASSTDTVNPGGVPAFSPDPSPPGSSQALPPQPGRFQPARSQPAQSRPGPFSTVRPPRGSLPADPTPAGPVPVRSLPDDPPAAVPFAAGSPAADSSPAGLSPSAPVPAAAPPAGPVPAGAAGAAGDGYRRRQSGLLNPPPGPEISVPRARPDAAAAQPVVEISIGRIEIRSRPAPRSADRPRADSPRVRPLGDYLAARRGRDA